MPEIFEPVCCHYTAASYCITEVHSIIVVIGSRQLITGHGRRNRLLTVLMMMMVAMAVMVVAGQSIQMKVGTLGMLGRFRHAGSGMGMRQRHALGKLRDNQNGRNKATHHILFRSFPLGYVTPQA